MTRLAVLVFTLSVVACPGCISRAVVTEAMREEPRSSADSFAVARIPVADRAVQLVAMDFRCRATVVGDGAPKPGEAWFERVPAKTVTDVAGDGERVLRAYAPQGGGPATIVVIGSDKGDSFAIRQDHGMWSRHRVSTGAIEAPGEPRSPLRWLFFGPLTLLGLAGDAVVGVTLGTLIVAACVSIVGIFVAYHTVHIWAPALDGLTR